MTYLPPFQTSSPAVTPSVLMTSTDPLPFKAASQDAALEALRTKDPVQADIVGAEPSVGVIGQLHNDRAIAGAPHKDHFVRTITREHDVYNTVTHTVERTALYTHYNTLDVRADWVNPPGTYAGEGPRGSESAKGLYYSMSQSASASSKNNSEPLVEARLGDVAPTTAKQPVHQVIHKHTSRTMTSQGSLIDIVM